jgi:hypothetical protein
MHAPPGWIAAPFGGKVLSSVARKLPLCAVGYLLMTILPKKPWQLEGEKRLSLGDCGQPRRDLLDRANSDHSNPGTLL